MYENHQESCTTLVLWDELSRAFSLIHDSSTSIGTRLAWMREGGHATPLRYKLKEQEEYETEKNLLVS